MWRSEERLEFWLSGGKPSAPMGRVPWLRRLQARCYGAKIEELPLAIECRTPPLESDLQINAKVLDGAALEDPAACFGDSTARPELPGSKIHCCDLLSGAAVHRVPVPDPHKTRIVQKKLIFHSDVRSPSTSIDLGLIRSSELLQKSPVKLVPFEKLGLESEAIHSHAQISELPHRRESLEIRQVSDPEKNSFLHEAEVLKLIRSDRAELLAIFRHIPIEVVSRLRFIAEKNEIRYSVSDEPKRNQTRVHDLAVIRDTANKEVHLVPHRTRSRLVSLA